MRRDARFSKELAFERRFHAEQYSAARASFWFFGFLKSNGKTLCRVELRKFFFKSQAARGDRPDGAPGAVHGFAYLSEEFLRDEVAFLVDRAGILDLDAGLFPFYHGNDHVDRRED